MVVAALPSVDPGWTKVKVNQPRTCWLKDNAQRHSITETLTRVDPVPLLSGHN